jgi:cold shock CspA family protein
MRHGTVVRFGSHGFGFVKDSENRKEYFVHIADIAGRRNLQAGQKVKFVIGEPTLTHFQRAVLVEVIESPNRIGGR